MTGTNMISMMHSVSLGSDPPPSKLQPNFLFFPSSYMSEGMTEIPTIQEILNGVSQGSVLGPSNFCHLY